jgi:hypothetical protein
MNYRFVVVRDGFVSPPVPLFPALKMPESYLFLCVVDNSRVNTTPIWWEVRPVLIMDPSD